MSSIQDRITNTLSSEEVQEGLSLLAATTSITHPVVASVISSFKEIASISDEIRFKGIIKGLASGFNDEKYSYKLIDYIKISDENAYHVSNAIRKAILSESHIACIIIGRMLADYAKKQQEFDQEDIIIVHALSSATDNDIIGFYKMNNNIDLGDYITGIEYDDYSVDWCLNNRLCRIKQASFIEEKQMLDMSFAIYPTTAAKKLIMYISEIYRFIDELK